MDNWITIKFSDNAIQLKKRNHENEVETGLAPECKGEMHETEEKRN